MDSHCIKRSCLYLILALLLGAGSFIPAQSYAQASSKKPSDPPQPTISPPLSHAVGRITKKTFGLYVEPKQSPVTPERFRGFHTGVDFETLPSEAMDPVPVNAICSGPLLFKRWISGYGGVAVQACKLNRQHATVVYGHLKLSSIKTRVGKTLSGGRPFAVLGTGYSKETDGERKHLHLGIHKGRTINLRGYVQKKSDVSGWIDAGVYLDKPSK